MKLAEIQSAGLRTDLEMLLFEGKLTERDTYLRIETPGNPFYYWGNYLVFEAPPTEGDIARWPEIFREEFAHEPRVRHCVLAWNSTEVGAAAEFTGFEQVWTDSLTLTAASLSTPKRHRPELEIRELTTDEEWDAAIANQVATRAEGFEFDSYLRFKTALMNRYRRMGEAGMGAWYGAYLDGMLVGDCGLYHVGPYGRFQSVGTHPNYRGRGICSTLIHHVAREGLKRSSELVICADPDYHAIVLYEGVGFRRQQRTLGLMRRPEKD